MTKKLIIKITIVSLLELLIFKNTFAQKDTTVVNDAGFIVLDTTLVDETEFSEFVTEIDTSHYKSPKKAAILSACLPGLGQFYNEKYWKVPLFLGLVGGASYGVYYTFSTYKYYLDSYVDVLNGQINPDGYSKEDLKTNKDKFRKFRDYSVLGWLAIYGLNVVDANIDAHFSNFDVSEDLSLNFNPFYLNLFNDSSIFGMNLVLYF